MWHVLGGTHNAFHLYGKWKMAWHKHARTKSNPICDLLGSDHPREIEIKKKGSNQVEQKLTRTHTFNTISMEFSMITSAKSPVHIALFDRHQTEEKKIHGVNNIIYLK